MTKFEEIYKQIIQEENEHFLSQSTKLVDENDEQIVKESLGKWLKNTFTKFGKNALEKELANTFNNVIVKYQFSPLKQNGQTNINLLGKREGDYIVVINLDPAKDNFKSKELSISVLEGDSKKPVSGLDKKIIKIKHSWTENEMVNAINQVIQPARIKLTQSAGKIDNLNKSEKTIDNKSQNKKSIGGFSMDELKAKVNETNENKEQKLSLLKSLASGWKKLTAEEQKAILNLK